MKKILITGFEPFGGESINPSWEAVKALPDETEEFSVTKMCIPVVFGKAAQLVLERAREVKPDIIISVGQAGGSPSVTPELVGINLRYARIPDNDGNSPMDTPVTEGGETAIFSTFPARKIAEGINKAGISARVSYSAGAYVCNDVLYTLLEHYKETEVKVGFIHVPFLPEQAKNGEPSMERRDMTKALEIACSITAE